MIYDFGPSLSLPLSAIPLAIPIINTPTQAARQVRKYPGIALIDMDYLVVG